MTEIRGLKKSFGAKTVFAGVDMDIPDAQITGLFGPSGCGKSTVARIACGLVSPDSGSVSLDGRLLADRDSYDRKLGLAVQLVWQQPYASLDPMQRVGAGLGELIRYHGLAKTRAEAKEAALEALRRVGLPEQTAGHLPGQLSGGEAQRVAIAKAVLLKPRLLILDEATSMLDVSTQANIAALVKKLMAESSMGVLMISHDRELLDVLADRIYVFNNGTVDLTVPCRIERR